MCPGPRQFGGDREPLNKLNDGMDETAIDRKRILLLVGDLQLLAASVSDRKYLLNCNPLDVALSPPLKTHNMIDIDRWFHLRSSCTTYFDGGIQTAGCFWQ